MAPRRLIIDDRNINWKNQKTFDPVSEQQLFELSQIPFDKKTEYAARYFTDHCNDCYCRDGLVSPTSKYLFDEANSSADEEAATCTCPLDHPCTLTCSNQNKGFKSHESLAPFLRSKKTATKTRFCVDERRDDQTNKSSYCRDEGPFVGRRGASASSCSDKTRCDERICLKNRERKVIKSQEIDENDCNRDDEKFAADLLKNGKSKSSDFTQKKSTGRLNYTKQREKYELHNNSTPCVLKHKCTKRNSSEETTKNKPDIINISNFRDQNYTKQQREKYELHNNPTLCVVSKHKCMKRNSGEEATKNTPNMSNISNFRDQYFFDTHNPFTSKNHPQCTLLDNCSTTPTKKSHKLSCSNEDNKCSTTKHQCVYSFQLNSRLKPIALNANAVGSSCCDVCNKPMSIVRNTDDINIQKETEQNVPSQFNYGNSKSGCAFGYITNNSSQRDEKEAALEPQKVHIGNGNERIQLTIPIGLLEESIGHSVELTSFGGHSKGGKGAVKQRGKGTLFWNNIGKGRAVNAAERPNSFALRQQKFSMYSK